MTDTLIHVDDLAARCGYFFCGETKQEEKPMKIIAVDFDGTITRRNTFPDKPKPEDIADHCYEVLQRLHKTHIIILYTCRRDQLLLDAISYCRQMGVPLDYLNVNAHEAILEFGGDCRKIFAHYYIDDQNLGGFPGWLEAERIIMREESEEHICCGECDEDPFDVGRCE